MSGRSKLCRCAIVLESLHVACKKPCAAHIRTLEATPWPDTSPTATASALGRKPTTSKRSPPTYAPGRDSPMQLIVSNI